MHALRPEFPGEGLRDGPLGELSRREGGEFGGASDGGCGTGHKKTGRVRRRGNSIKELGERLLGKVEQAVPGSGVSRLPRKGFLESTTTNAMAGQNLAAHLEQHQQLLDLRGSPQTSI